MGSLQHVQYRQRFHPLDTAQGDDFVVDEALQLLDVGHRDVGQEIEAAQDLRAGEHLVEAGHRLFKALHVVDALILERKSHEQLQIAADFRRIDLNGVTFDDSVGFQAPNPLQRGRFRKPDVFGQLAVGQVTIQHQTPQNLLIKHVHIEDYGTGVENYNSLFDTDEFWPNKILPSWVIAKDWFRQSADRFRFSIGMNNTSFNASGTRVVMESYLSSHSMERKKKVIEEVARQYDGKISPKIHLNFHVDWEELDGFFARRPETVTVWRGNRGNNIMRGPFRSYRKFCEKAFELAAKISQLNWDQPEQVGTYYSGKDHTHKTYWV